MKTTESNRRIAIRPTIYGYKSSGNGQLIQNLTWQDGSAFELPFATEMAHRTAQNGHNFGHNG